MPIIVPPPEQSEAVDLSEERVINRALTHTFILFDPVQIVLTPYTEVRTASGAVSMVAQAPREVQTFRLIPVSSNERPQGSTSGQTNAGNGVQRKYDFTIMGEWDSLIEENDVWEDEVGQKWIVDSILSYNGYERKGMVMSYGRRPRHG